MGISGSQHAKTPARAGILRAGAGRSGWPVQLGVKVKTYALSGIARSGATRSNYHSGLFFIMVNGVHVGTARPDPGLPGQPKGILLGNLEIEDTLNETASTLNFAAIGFVPALGAEIVIMLGSKNNRAREFAGTVLSRAYDYAGKPANYRHHVSCIDYTWGMNTRKITERYMTTSVYDIISDLLTKYAPTYTMLATGQELKTAILDEITYTNEDLPDAITRALKRVGGNWYCDYWKDIHAFFGLDPTLQPPGIINAVNPSLLHLTFTPDLSQFLTRVYVEGGGANAYATPAGATVLPVQDPSWYPPSGVVVSGPQRIKYTGVQLGGGGSLVGPGASPSQRLVLARAAGVGLADGQYWFSYTYTTATGESKSSPAMWIVVGPTPPPTDAPTNTTIQAGPGPATGEHEYAVTFRTPTGETTPGPRLIVHTTEVAAPEAAPVPDPPTAGVGLDDGDHAYAVSFETDDGHGYIGETPVGPVSATVRTGSRTVPSVAPTCAAPKSGSGPDPGDHKYALTFEYADAETQAGPLSSIVTTKASMPKASTAPTAVQGAGISGWYFPGDQIKFTQIFVRFSDGSFDPTKAEYAGESSPSATLTAVAYPQSNGCYTFDLSNLEVPTDTQVIEKWVYLWINGVRRSFMRLYPYTTSWTGYGTGITYTYSGMPALVSGASCTVDLSNLQIAPIGTGIKSRNLYRTAAGGSQLKLLTKLSATVDPQATTYSDRTSDNSLGVNVPTGATTATSQVKVNNILTGTGVTRRKLYRRDGTAPLKLLTVINDNTTRSYLDVKPAASLGGSPPTVNTAVAHQVPLRDIPLGEAGIVTGRAIYRTPAAGLAAPTWAGTLVDLGGTLPVSPPGLYAVDDVLNAYIVYLDAANQPSLIGPPSNNLIAREAGPPSTPGTAAEISVSWSHELPAGVVKVRFYLRAANPTKNVWIGYLEFLASAFDVSGSWVFRNPIPGSPPSQSPTGLQFAFAINDNTTKVALDTVLDSALGAAPPSTNTAAANQVAVSGIAVGADTVLSRTLYRTKVNDTNLKRLGLIGDNSTTTYLDAAPDAALGTQQPPTQDTSGLAQPSGVVQPGTTNLIVASTAAFSPTGGLVVIGNGQQVIRYTGISGNALTGVPAIGPGSITASVSYSSTATVPPTFTGIPATGEGAIRWPIPTGDPVNIWIQEDDLAAQAALKQYLGYGDGIVEDVIQDNRLSYTEARARGRAHLSERAQIHVTVRVRTRDRNMRTGALLTVNMGDPINLAMQTFLIQHVVESALADQKPVFDVDASTTLYSFEELLRLIRKGE